jgi:hypothetical protein
MLLASGKSWSVGSLQSRKCSSWTRPRELLEAEQSHRGVEVLATTGICSWTIRVGDDDLIGGERGTGGGEKHSAASGLDSPAATVNRPAA